MEVDLVQMCHYDCYGGVVDPDVVPAGPDRQAMTRTETGPGTPLHF